MADEGTDRIVEAIELDVPIARVWRAITDYKEFGAWFCVALDQPFEPGGDSTGRITYPDHEHMRWVAYVDEMEPERLFSFRWYDSEDGACLYEGQPPILVEFKFEQIPAGTRLTIIESGYSALPEARRKEVMARNEEGWSIQARNIAEYLAT